MQSSSAWNNIQLTVSSFPKYSNGNDINYFFHYIDFKNIEVITADKIPTGEDVSVLMKNKNMLAVINKIKLTSSILQTYTSGVNTIALSSAILNQTDCNSYNEQPSGIQLINGTIIPQPIIPSRTYLGADNGISAFNDGTQKTLMGSGINWMPSAFTINSSFMANSSLNSSLTTSNLNLLKSVALYGTRQNNMYINNAVSLSSFVDMPIIANRIYTGSSTETSGAFSIAYNFSVYNAAGQGLDDTQRKQAPLIQYIAPVKTGLKGLSNQFSITIPPDGQLKVALGFNCHANGSFSTPEGALLPPACVQTKQGVTNKALFVIPLFTGVIVTNNIVKSQKSTSDMIFVPFEDRTNYFNYANFDFASDDLRKMSESQGHQNKFKYLPAYLKEHFNSTTNGLAVKDDVPFEISSKNMKFTFDKSVGSFAYCPLYFHRHLVVNLFFKGHVQRQIDSNKTKDGQYAIYPVYHASGNWSIDAQVSQSAYYLNSATSEAIYSAHVSCFTSSLSRLPIQLFGVVVALRKQGYGFNLKNDNGTFLLQSKPYSALPSSFHQSSDEFSWGKYITKCSVQCGFDGVNGSLTLDGYALYGDQVFTKLLPKQSVGGISLSIGERNIFKGFAMEISKSTQENNYDVTVNLAGIQKKLQDMKLINCPFFDGDKLQKINDYFMKYSGVEVAMINYESKDSSKDSTAWTSNIPIIGGKQNRSFTVGVSDNWESPHINFETGKPVWDAYQELAKDTSCIFAPGLDGKCYFFEMDDDGKAAGIVKQPAMIIDIADIISFSLTPHVSNMYNNLITIGYIVKSQQQGNSDAIDNLAPGMYQDVISDALFPWSRHSLSVSKGHLTKSQLYMIHKNRVRFAKSFQCQGQLVIKGDTKVKITDKDGTTREQPIDIQRLYKKIKIGGANFFVISIEHSIDLNSKTWTTTLGIQTIVEDNSDIG